MMAENENIDEDLEEYSLDPKNRGLGRGLNALFDDDEDFSEDAGSATASADGLSRQVVGVDQLQPGFYQPRHNMNEEALKELADSIATHGVLQPILVRTVEGQSVPYEIIAGERRWRAAQIAQLHEVPVVIKEFDDLAALEIGLIENLQREDLNPIEEAKGYQRLMNEFGHTQSKLGASLGKSRSHIANMVRLLTLPNAVQGFLLQGKLTAGHARALITAEDPEGLAATVVLHGYSVRETERLAAGYAERTPPSGKRTSGGKKSTEKDIDTLALEKEVGDRLGMKVSIDPQNNGKGSMKITYTNLDQLDEILHRLSNYQEK